MKYENPENYKHALEIQKKLRNRLKLKTEINLDDISIIAGCDNALVKKQNKILAAFVVFKKQNNEWQIVEKKACVEDLEFPYIPGMLSFREIPSLLKAFKKLKNKPQLIFVDGQGYAHPRRMGLASHLSLILDVPAVGVAKSRLIGEYKEPGKKKGSFTDLYDENEIIGKVLRTRDNVKPVFISPGNKISIKDCVKLVLKVTEKYRIPIPTRQAHIAAAKFKKEFLNEE